jgi:hypothetical protein
VRHSSQCCAPGLGAYVEFINKPVQLTVSALPTTGPAPFRVAYTASSQPRLSPPPLRPPRRAYARHETEQADALFLRRCSATASINSSM